MSDLVPALIASRDGQLKNFDLRWYPDAALTVVMAAKGYPGNYEKGSVIEGLDAAAQVEGVEIFHAGTKADGGSILANGGRVLNVSARGKTVREAQSARLSSPSTASGGRTASAAATSAGRRSSGRRAVVDRSVRRGIDSPCPISPISSPVMPRTGSTPPPGKSSRAQAARGRRCCCCTATPRPT